ncbi:MAG: thioredoxin [Chitinophagales bacterium]
METKDKKSFSDYIHQNKPVLVDFYAEWCGPCRVMHPILEELKQKMNDDITVLKINVDKNARVASKYQIQGVPTLILFKNGQAMWRQSGIVSAKQLEQIITSFK